MDERQLKDLVKQDSKLSKRFIGVFAADELESLDISRLARPLALICNTERRGAVGEHWQALYLEDDASASFFCSMGLSPADFITDFVRRSLCPPLRYSTYSLQSPISSSCGAWAVIFLKRMVRGASMSQFVLSYADYDWTANEEKLSRQVRSSFRGY